MATLINPREGKGSGDISINDLDVTLEFQERRLSRARYNHNFAHISKEQIWVGGGLWWRLKIVCTKMISFPSSLLDS